MVIINVLDDKRFEFNGVAYPRVYMANTAGSNSIAIYGLNDKKNQLLAPTHYSEIQVDGTIYTSQTDTIYALVPVLNNSSTGGGTGGTTITNITQIPNRSYNDLQDLPDLSGGIAVTDTNGSLEKKSIATINGSPISETLTEFRQPILSGDVLTLTYVGEDFTEQIVTVNLGSLREIPGAVSATFDNTTGALVITDASGTSSNMDLSVFNITGVADPVTGVVSVMQDGVVRATISKVGETGDYNDLLNKPTAEGAHTHLISDITDFPTNISHFTNDSGYVTPSYVATQIGAIPIPESTSDLVNDSGFVTSSQIEGTIDVTTNLPLTTAHKGKTLICSGTIQITVPTGLGTDFTVNLINDGTGIVSVVSSGTTLKAPYGLNLAPDTAGNILKKTGAETFYLQGEFSE